MRTDRVLTNLTCDQNCPFCDARCPTEDPAFVRAGAVRERIDRAVAAGAGELVLTGGEPTLRRDLPALVAHARSRGARVVLETNGRSIDPERARALAAAGVECARVHLPAWGDEADAVTRDPGGFRATRRGLDALAAAGVRLELQTPIVRANLHLVGAIPEGVARSGLPVRALLLVVPMTAPDPTTLARVAEATAAVRAVEGAGRAVGLPVRLDMASYLAPCLFDRPDRVAHLYSLNRGSAGRPGYARVAACADCAARDRCPGLAEALLAREALAPTPIRDDRTRRRLTVISSVEEQVRREMTAREVTRLPGSAEAVAVHTVRVNFHCNQSCHFCFVSTHLPPPEEADVRAAIVEAGRAGAVLSLSGGEPTLNPRLAEYVRLGRAAGARMIELQTNAIRLGDPAAVRALEEAGLDEAMVSLHGSTAAVCDHVTNAPGTFARTVLGLDALARSAVRVRISFVFCQANYADFPALVALVAARWPRAIFNVSFVGSHTDVVPRTADMIPRCRDVMPSLLEGLRLAREASVRVTGFESMCGVPLCLVPEAQRGHFALPELPEGEGAEECVKADACQRCALSTRCYGVRRGYAELHGTGELNPVAP